MIPMPDSPTRLSPVHDLLEELQPCWGSLEGMPVALTYGGRTLEQERDVAGTLGLCDVSALPRLVVKGPGAESFLKERAVADTLPADILGVLPLRSGGLIARTGSSEFFLEDAPSDGRSCDLVVPLSESLRNSPEPGVYPALRQDASFLLSGDRAPAVLLQTCGFDFSVRQVDRAASPGPDRTMPLVMTGVAGVSTWVLRRTLIPHRVYQLWADGTYGPYLWETLLQVAREFGGTAVGLSAFFPAV
jgi:sarcosine oxidase subunit gamma